MNANPPANQGKNGIGRALFFGALVVAVLALALWAGRHRAPSRMPRKTGIVPVRLAAPTPRPPEPPQAREETKPRQEMIEQPPVENEAPKSEPPVSTGIKGDGAADGFGVGAAGGTRLGGGGAATQGGRWGWYAGQVQTAIHAALWQKREVRDASFSVKVRLWADATGRVVRAKLDPVDPGRGEAIQAALLGLQLKEPPPPDMPMPIVLRVTLKKSTP